MRVLIIEDSANLRESLRLGLTREGFAVDVAEDGEVGLSLARNNPYDALILDLMLPKIDGLDVLAELNGRPNRPHVLVLTAKDRVKDRVVGLNAGADDYLAKPFAFAELLARLRAVVRRRYGEHSSTLLIDGLEIDTVAHRASYQGATLDLTAREFALLEYLAARQGHTVSREEIEDHIYGVHKLPSSNAIDSTICILRSKLGPVGRGLLRTKRGQGYVLDEKSA